MSQLSERLDRLAGDGSSVVGIDLAALFRAILNQLQDNPGGVTAAGLIVPVRGAVSNHARVEHLYGGNGSGPWDALIGDALAQLKALRYAACDDDVFWRIRQSPEGAFATGKRLTVIRSRKPMHGSVGVVIYPAAEREALGRAETLRMEITSLAARLREDGPGLRPVDPKQVDALKASMEAYGWQDFPVLYANDPRAGGKWILDGRHRLAAAKAAGVEVTWRKVKVRTAEDALAAALAANETQAWSAADKKRLAKLLQADGFTPTAIAAVLGTNSQTKRERVKAALLEFPELSHRAIAKQVGAHHQQVDHACRRLMDESSISECRHRLTEDGKQAPGPKPAPARQRLVDDPLIHGEVRGRIDAGEPVRTKDIANRHGVSKNTVHRVVDIERDRAAHDAIQDQPSRERVLELVRRLSSEDREWLLNALGAK